MYMKNRTSQIILSLLVIMGFVLSSFASAQAQPAAAPAAPLSISAGTGAPQLVELGRYTSPSASEISAYDEKSHHLFVVSPTAVTILDISDPKNPTLVRTLGYTANSVAIYDGLVALAVQATDPTDNGFVAFLDSEGFAIKNVTVGALPDMVTFSPDGKKVLVANEGEPGLVNPQGSVSIIDLSAGVANATASHVLFTGLESSRYDLVNRGVRIFANAPSVAQDLEPEYIAVSADSTTAMVTIQEANTIAVIDIATATIKKLIPLGLKDFSRGLPELKSFDFGQMPVIGSTTAGQQLKLGGFSGLFYEGLAANGAYKFVTHTDRGPNGEPTNTDADPALERPFALPTFQLELVRFDLHPVTGLITITQRISLTQQNGTTPLSGLPNLRAQADGLAYTDEEPVDLNGNVLTLDPLGADPEGVQIASDGSFWMVDEYRPSIYHFSPQGVLLNRFVPTGTASLAGQPLGTYGSEVLPAEYAQRRANRGFEGAALEGSTLYAFIQSSLDNPDTTGDTTSRAGRNLRILAFNTISQTVSAEYFLVLNDVSGSGTAKTDKIGDALSLGNGRFMVVERDDRTTLDANKLIYEIDLTGATNLMDPAAKTALAGLPKTLEASTVDELNAAGIKPVFKRLVTNLGPLGYTGVSKPEGLAMIDANTFAVINDNDFGILAQAIPLDGSVPLNPTPEPIRVGLLTFSGSNGLDASDRDGVANGKAINIQKLPVFGLYQPDGIASINVSGTQYYVTANEGDSRVPTSELVRLSTLNLDDTVFPNEVDLKTNLMLGRLNVSSVDGDRDADGDYERIYTIGGRSLSVWDSAGNLVFDSGDLLEQLTASLTPSFFNANDGAASKWDERSDDKGPEPEGVEIGYLGGRPYAFIGLERAGGGVMVFDMSNPRKPKFVTYARSDLDISPEGLKFIPAAKSPNGQALLVVTNEVSNTTTIYAFTGAVTNDSAYVKPAFSGVTTTPILTAGEAVPQTSSPLNDYRMVGIPDGLGAYKDAQGNIHLFVNHELGNTVLSTPVVGGPQIKGAFVSEFIHSGVDGSVLSGDLAFNTVQRWNGTSFDDRTADWQAGSNTFGRFCSGFLGGPDFGLETQIYFAGEETSGVDSFDKVGGGAAVAVVNRTAYVLPDMGYFAKENVVVAPGTGAKTVVFLLEDGPSGLDSQLYMYVGTKNPTAATIIEREGLVGGALYFFRSLDPAHTDESNFRKADGSLNGEWVSVQSVLQGGETVSTIADTVLDARVKAAGAFNVIRVEDAEFSVTQSGVLYFATTGSTHKYDTVNYTNKMGRIYRFSFDPANPTSGTNTIQVLLEGDAGDPVVNPDNIAINANEEMTIQEDPNSEHRGNGLLAGLGRDSSIWFYNVNTKMIMRIGEIDQTAVPNTAGYRDIFGFWETSGIIDASGLFGPGAYMLVTQAHSLNSSEASALQGSASDLGVVEGGQILLMKVPQPFPFLRYFMPMLNR